MTEEQMAFDGVTGREHGAQGEPGDAVSLVSVHETLAARQTVECEHKFRTVEVDVWEEGGWAECRDCGKVADFTIEYDEWLSPDEYDRRQEESDEAWAKLRSK